MKIKISIECKRIETYILAALQGRIVQMDVELVKHLTQAFRWFFIWLDQNGLEIDRQSVTDKNMFMRSFLEEIWKIIDTTEEQTPQKLSKLWRGSTRWSFRWNSLSAIAQEVPFNNKV